MTQLSSSLRVEARLGILSILSDSALVCIALPPNVSLKENLDVYYDETRTQPFFNIRERKLIGLSQTFDVATINGQLIASFQHNGITSIIRESWSVLDTNGKAIGYIKQSVIGGFQGRAEKTCIGRRA